MMRQGHRDPSEGSQQRGPPSHAALVWGVPARTLPGLAPERPPQPQPARVRTTGQRSLQGGMMVVSRPWGSEGQPVPPPLPALCPKVKGTTKQAGPRSRLASGQGVLGLRGDPGREGSGTGDIPSLHWEGQTLKRSGRSQTRADTASGHAPSGAWDASPYGHPRPLPRAPPGRQ